MDSRLYHFIIKEFRQLWRDPRMLRVALTMPLLQLIIFGYIASTDIKNVPTGVMDEDRTSMSRAYIRNVVNSGNFVLKYDVSSEKGISDLLDSGRISFVLRIPKDFQKDLASGQNSAVQLLIDGSNSSNATIILGYMSLINFDFSNGILLDRLNKTGLTGRAHSLFDLETRIWYNPEMKSMYFMVPAIFANILMMISMILTMFSVVKEKEKGTIEQLIVTPLRPYEMMLGKMLPAMTVALADTLLAFLVATLWFRVPMHGSIILLFVLGMLFSMTGLAIGLLISTVSRNQRQAMMTNMLFMSPQMILSGFIFPIASMPVLIQYITYLIPLRYFLIIVRGLFLKGIGVRYLWSQIWPMIVFVTVMLTLSVARFQRKLE